MPELNIEGGSEYSFPDVQEEAKGYTPLTSPFDSGNQTEGVKPDARADVQARRSPQPQDLASARSDNVLIAELQRKVKALTTELELR